MTLWPNLFLLSMFYRKILTSFLGDHILKITIGLYVVWWVFSIFKTKIPQALLGSSSYTEAFQWPRAPLSGSPLLPPTGTGELYKAGLCGPCSCAPSSCIHSLSTGWSQPLSPSLLPRFSFFSGDILGSFRTWVLFFLLFVCLGADVFLPSNLASV